MRSRRAGLHPVLPPCRISEARVSVSLVMVHRRSRTSPPGWPRPGASGRGSFRAAPRSDRLGGEQVDVEDHGRLLLLVTGRAAGPGWDRSSRPCPPPASCSVRGQHARAEPAVTRRGLGVGLARRWIIPAPGRVRCYCFAAIWAMEWQRRCTASVWAAGGRGALPGRGAVRRPRPRQVRVGGTAQACDHACRPGRRHQPIGCLGSAAGAGVLAPA
jgi:hypothetical protein